MDFGPPSYVIPYGTYMHRAENNFVVKCTDPSRVPKFNRGVYLESKAKVGTIDQIMGPTSNFYFSVKPAEGVTPDGFKPDQVLYMNPEDLLPMDRFTSTKKPSGPRPAGGGRGGGRGGFGGGRGGGRGGFSGGRGGGAPRGAPRGGFGGGRGGRGGFTKPIHK